MRKIKIFQLTTLHHAKEFDISLMPLEERSQGPRTNGIIRARCDRQRYHRCNSVEDLREQFHIFVPCSQVRHKHPERRTKGTSVGKIPCWAPMMNHVDGRKHHRTITLKPLQEGKHATRRDDNRICTPEAAGE